MIIVVLVLLSMNTLANDNKKIVKSEVAIEVKNTEVKKEVKNEVTDLDMSDINTFLECNNKHKNLNYEEESNIVLKMTVDKFEAKIQEELKNKAVK